jgi:deoxyhypusine synthase
LVADARECASVVLQASLNEFAGFKSEGALRLGKVQDNTLFARVAAQATTVRPLLAFIVFSRPF